MRNGGNTTIRGEVLTEEDSRLLGCVEETI